VRKQKTERQAFPINKHVIDRIIFPVKTKRGLKWGKKRQSLPDQQQEPTRQHPIGKLLDGFLILLSCRVKLPHEAIRSRLNSQNIVEVIEEDLCYFQNLYSLDLSDNSIRLEQLRNLRNLCELNLSYNMVQTVPELLQDDFPKLESLDLSFNSLEPTVIPNLYSLKNLRRLDLSANSLITLPPDLNQFPLLEDLNLSSNMFTSKSSLVSPQHLFKAMGRLKKLKVLNLSRNKFSGFHSELLNPESDFHSLQDLDLSYNSVQIQEDLYYILNCKAIQTVTITGNPFAMQTSEHYQDFEKQLLVLFSATLINEVPFSQKAYLRKSKPKKEITPYPNPIKLMSRPEGTEVKGDYLKAEMMNKGIALPISDIRPDSNVSNDIFPR